MQALILMIQQNFEESEEDFPTPYYALPGPRIFLNDRIFGRNLMDENYHVPTLSLITISIGRGDLFVIENNNDYYSRFSSTANIFDSSPHHNYRRSLLGLNPSGNSSSKDILFIATFEGLHIQFAHRHYLAGNGIEVSVEHIVIRAPQSAGFSSPVRNRQIINSARILIASKYDPLISHEKRNTVDHSKGPQIRYSQQGCLNFRRCKVEIRDSFLSLQLNLIVRSINYFLDPVQFLNERYSLVLSKDKSSPDMYEFKASMDVEVSVLDSLICTSVLPSRAEVACLNIDLDYSHCWRGFLGSGPGKISQLLDTHVRKIFVADICDVGQQRAESIFKPFYVKANIQLLISPTSKSGRLQLEILRRYMCLPDWSVPDPVLKVDGNQYYRILFNFVSKDSMLEMRLSLKDALFFIRTGGLLLQDFQVLPAFPSYFISLSSMLNDFSDLIHLRPVTEYAVHVVNSPAKLVIKKIDVGGGVHPLQFTLVNNIYNLRIARLNINLADFCYVFHHDSTRSLAGGSTISGWIFNDRLAEWEPFIEPFDVTCVSTTDVSTVENSHHSKEKVEMNSTGIDFVLSQYMLTSFIKKMSFPDVHMSLSHRPTPYSVKNSLGIPVHCCVRLGQTRTIFDEMIYQNGKMDIESHHFGIIASSSLSIDFVLNDHKFYSRYNLEMDTEGVFPFSLESLDGDGELSYPIVFLDHTIKSDGSRMLTLRGLLIIKNSTGLICEIALKWDVRSESVSLEPGSEWTVPLYLSHKGASLYIRIGESSWTRALHSLDMMVLWGRWGSPHQLRSQLCECAQFGLKASSNTVVIKPVVGSSSHSTGIVPVRAPNIDTVREFSNPTSQGKTPDPFLEFRSTKPASLSLVLLPPVTFYNQLCQPFLYRLSNADGFIFAEGALNPCESVNLYVVPKLFEDRYYVRCCFRFSKNAH